MTPLPVADLDHILERGGGIFEDLRGKRLFVTGGTGFFGIWILSTIAHACDALGLGARVVLLTRDPVAFRARAPALAAHPAIEVIEGDVRSFAFPPGPFDLVIHAATEASAKVNDEDPLRMLDTIVAGTRRALDFARAAGARRLLLTSSGAVYGRQPPELRHVPEDFPGAPAPADPASAYGQGKRLAEHLCALYGRRHGLECTIARCFAFVGPHLPLDAHFAIGNFIRDGLAGGPVRVGGDGTPFRSYLHAADLAVHLVTVLLRGAPGRPYNVGSEEDVSIADLARRVAAVFGAEVTIACAPAPGRPAERYVPSTRRAADELGLRTWIGLDDAIARTAKWHREARRETS